jgi:primosomal protein N' (replication factor Y) (superfamily II helicase)
VIALTFVNFGLSPMPYFAQVILPVAVRSTFTYRVPDALWGSVVPGVRVVAPLGKGGKLYTGVVASAWEEADEEDRGFVLRDIEAVQDESPVISSQQLELYRWIAFYYCCTEGEVLNASLPSGLKPESGIRILPGAESPPDEALRNIDYLFFETLIASGELSINRVRDVLGLKNPLPRLRKWEAQGWLRFSHTFEEIYKPKTKMVVEIAEAFRNDAGLSHLLSEQSAHPKREAVLMHVISAWYNGETFTAKELRDKAGVSDSVINTLVKQGALSFRQVLIDRTAGMEFKSKGEGEILTELQESALSEIRDAFGQSRPQPVLLHGITGSGKTRVYQELIHEVLEQEQQVLYILPEIALTRQVIDRMKTAFGERVGVYHSRFNEQERVEIWNKILDGTYQMIIGVRSSILLPFENLGLIIVDEEHDQGLRQHERPPYYHARNVALWYAHHFSVPLILGSATPSLESYYRAQQGKYKLVEMLTRIHQTLPPKIEVIDMQMQAKFRLSTGIFSDVVLEGLRDCLLHGHQAIILRNRRGYAPVLICQDCGHIQQCANCDISLTYHKSSGEMRCHYCGFSHPIHHRCESCGSLNVKLQGAGTERVEEDLQELFPTARMLRMDQDTTRRKKASDGIIDQMEKHAVDFLVGTQMVSKGLDFEKVTLAVVMNAEQMLGFPDFRASEHAYQLLTQVAGRTGRRQQQGRVLIQSKTSDHPVLHLLQKPYTDFYDWEIHVREQALYPPFTRLIRLEMRHANEPLVYAAAEALRIELQLHFDKAILGPEPALIGRIRNEYILQFLIKIHPATDTVRVRKLLMEALEQFYKQEKAKGIRVKIEIDP